jgi:hypothetical protein
MIGVAGDHPGAGAEDRAARLVMGAQRRLQAGRLDALGDRRALAAGDDQAVEVVELGGNADLGRLCPELAQSARVRLEVALDR